MSVNIYRKETDTLEEVPMNVTPGFLPNWTGTKAMWESLDKSQLMNGAQINITDDAIDTEGIEAEFEQINSQLTDIVTPNIVTAKTNLGVAGTTRQMNVTIGVVNGLKFLKLEGYSPALTAGTTYTVGNFQEHASKIHCYHYVQYTSSANGIVYVDYKQNGDITIRPLSNISDGTAGYINDVFY